MSKNKIEELLEKNKERTQNINVQKNTIELTEQLRNEKVVSFTDYSLDDLKVIDFAEEFKNIVVPDNVSKTLDLRDEPQAKMSTSEQEDIDELNEVLDELDRKDFENQSAGSNNEEGIKYKANPNNVIIEFDNVTMRYTKLDRLIEGLNLKIHEGEFLYLVGPSGSGKSTLSRLIYRDINNIGGSVWVDGINATLLKSKNLHRLRQKIGIIFQDYKLLPNLTIYENVRYTLDVIGYPKDKREAKVFEALKKVGIEEHKDKFPRELSGGQQQRAAIARAIVNDPKIIVADEPTGNLDPKNADIIMRILERINKNGTTVIMATHDTKIVDKFKHRTIKIQSGSIKKEQEGGYIYE